MNNSSNVTGAGRLAAQVVSALVGYNDAKSRSRQRLDLFAPAIPKFRETMEKKHDGPVFRSSRDRVNADTRIFKINGIHGIALGDSLLCKRESQWGELFYVSKTFGIA